MLQATRKAQILSDSNCVWPSAVEGQDWTRYLHYVVGESRRSGHAQQHRTTLRCCLGTSVHSGWINSHPVSDNLGGEAVEHGVPVTFYYQ